MKRGGSKLIRCGGLTFVAMIVACGLSAPAYAQATDPALARGQAPPAKAGVVLLLEQTPVKGGQITPVAGVYHFAPGAEVSLSATPKPGYQFVHWLGDVGDPTATSTIVCLNKPKVVIAVFERIEHGIGADEQAWPTPGGGAPTGLFPTVVDLGRSAGFSGAGGAKPRPSHNIYVIGGTPAPQTPEPASGALLLLGSLLALARRPARPLK